MFKVRFRRGATTNNQERIARAARILVEPLLARMKEIETNNISLENELAAAKSKAVTVDAQHNRERIGLEAHIEDLEAEKVELVNDLARAQYRANEVSTDLNTGILVNLLQKRIKEITATNVSLEHKLAVATSEARQADQERTTLEARVGELDEKNTKLQHTLNDRVQELDLLKKDAAQNNPTALKSRIETLERAATFPHLKFGPDAARDYVNLSGKGLQAVNNKLALLDESALEWRVTGGARPSWKCEVKDESDTVKDGKKLSEKRRFRSYHGTKELFTLHANIGHKRRIHLRIDPSKREVEIGYIGNHLPIPTA